LKHDEEQTDRKEETLELDEEQELEAISSTISTAEETMQISASVFVKFFVVML